MIAAVKLVVIQISLFCLVGLLVPTNSQQLVTGEHTMVIQLGGTVVVWQQSGGTYSYSIPHTQFSQVLPTVGCFWFLLLPLRV